MREFRKIRSDKLRDLIVKDRYYNLGNYDYDDLFAFCDDCEYADILDLAYVAREIKYHSETNDTFNEIMACIVNNCCETYFK